MDDDLASRCDIVRRWHLCTRFGEHIDGLSSAIPGKPKHVAAGSLCILSSYQGVGTQHVCVGAHLRGAASLRSVCRLLHPPSACTRRCAGRSRASPTRERLGESTALFHHPDDLSRRHPTAGGPALGHGGAIGLGKVSDPARRLACAPPRAGRGGAPFKCKLTPRQQVGFLRVRVGVGDRSGDSRFLIISKIGLYQRP